VLALESGRAATLERQAGVYIELGEPARAAKQLEQIVERDPTNSSARQLLVRARLALRARREESELE
jgi:predicted Zn-dependent protease